MWKKHPKRLVHLVLLVVGVAIGFVAACSMTQNQLTVNAADDTLSDRDTVAGATTPGESDAGASTDASTKVKPSKVMIEPRVDRIMMQMSEFLANHKTFAFRADIYFDDVIETGQKLHYTAGLEVAVRRPNGIYAEYLGDIGARRLWYDGKTMTMLDADKDIYASANVPANIDDAFDHIMNKYRISMPLATLTYGHLYDAVKENIWHGFYVGMHEVDGVRCHHLAFTQESIDWQIWVEDGRQFVPRKIVITYKNAPQAPQYAAKISDWDFAPYFHDGLFEADIPKSTERIDLLEIKRESENPVGE